MLSGNQGAVPAQCALGEGAALTSCLPRLLANIDLMRWIGGKDWFLMLKWNLEALLRPSYSECWREGCFCETTWHLNLIGSLNLWQLSLTRLIWQRGQPPMTRGTCKIGPIRQECDMFWLHCWFNDSWYSGGIKRCSLFQVKEETGCWDPEEMTKSLAHWLSAPFDSCCSSFLPSSHPSSIPPSFCYFKNLFLASQHVQSELFIWRNGIPARQWNRILFVQTDSFKINKVQTPPC